MATKKATPKKPVKPAPKKKDPAKKKPTSQPKVRKSTSNLTGTKKQLKEALTPLANMAIDELASDSSDVRLVMKSKHTGEDVVISLGDDIAPTLRKILQIEGSKANAATDNKSFSKLELNPSSLTFSERLQHTKENATYSHNNCNYLANIIKRLTGNGTFSFEEKEPVIGENSLADLAELNKFVADINSREKEMLDFLSGSI